MRAGCCGSCRQGRDACTMPGTCHRVQIYPTRRRWWRNAAAPAWLWLLTMLLVLVAIFDALTR